jgi:4-amino-4-deoxy-L-arabinose transferase-like glycosyltransferase
LLLGSVPGVAWLAVGLLKYGQTFITTGIVNQPLQHLWASITTHNSPPGDYLIQALKFLTPWLIFFPYGLRLAWVNRNWGWAKLVLVWAGAYLLAILVMVTNYPGMIACLPSFSACGWRFIDRSLEFTTSQALSSLLEGWLEFTSSRGNNS